jgi:hypothetical protein
VLCMLIICSCWCLFLILIPWGFIPGGLTHALSDAPGLYTRWPYTFLFVFFVADASGL